jgi:hypothetical protein
VARIPSPPLPTPENAYFQPGPARPVPFCLQGFFPPPLTSPRVLVADVPARRFASCILTISKSRCSRGGCPAIDAGNSISPTDSCSGEKTGIRTACASILLPLFSLAYEHDSPAGPWHGSSDQQ